MLFKVRELSAEVDVRDVEMETDSRPVPVPAAASASSDTVDLSTDDDADDDSNEIDGAVSVHSVSDDDSEINDENLNIDDDRGSSVDIYESRTPSPQPADTAAVVVVHDASSSVPAETGNSNTLASVLAAENTVAHAVLPGSELDNSLSCFKTTKRKKLVVSPPVSKDDDVDETEVCV